MEQSGLECATSCHIGPLNRVYEVLARKRPLTLHMIRRLQQGFGHSGRRLLAKSEMEPIAA